MATALPRPHVTTAWSLPELAGAVGTVGTVGAYLSGPAAEQVAVTGVAMASDLVRPGDLFAAAPGAHDHGITFAPRALAGGAVAVLTDAAGRERLAPDVPVLVVPDVRASVGPLAALVYGRPSRALDVYGVTGTSGKTTTTYLLRAGLRAAGIETGLMGTVATLVGGQALATGFTTPEAPLVQALLAVMAERGARAVTMEVSSHALALGRADGIEFAVAGFTNLSQEHLDFHTDMDDYFAAKARLFDGRARRAVVVTDDEWGLRLAGMAGPGVVTVDTTGAARATWRADSVAVAADGSLSFRLRGPGVEVRAGCSLPGRFNVANTALALAMLAENGVDPELTAPALATAAVPGRMERVAAGQPFLAVVDYSHKPAAVAGALAALRPLTDGRLIVVLGCGGDRDRAKRPVMGEIAARDADVLIATDDNPRSEDPAAIRASMLAGVAGVPAALRATVLEIGDRGAAIAEAVRLARPGDTVLVAGKGHETGQEIAGVVHPFDDRVVLRAALTAAADPT